MGSPSSFLSYKSLKLKLTVFLARHIVAMVTCSTRMTAHCLTGVRSPEAPWLRAWATIVLYKVPERVPNFITKAIDSNFLVNYIPVLGHNTVKVLMYLASVNSGNVHK